MQGAGLGVVLLQVTGEGVIFVQGVGEGVKLSSKVEESSISPSRTFVWSRKLLFLLG